MTSCDAFILIGGKSSRLGIDKAFADLDGTSLLERALRVTRDAISPERVTAVVGSETQFAIRATSASLPFVFDLYEGRGPVGGIHAALANARTEWIFVLACDYPFVRPDLIRLLAAAAITDEFGAVVPQQQDGRMQPLCGFYNVEKVRPIIESILERPRSTPPVHEVVMQLNPRVLGFDEYSHLAGAADCFLNINTMEDLTAARDKLKLPLRTGETS